MELIAKKKLIRKEWHSFERYPIQGSDIVLHLVAYHIRQNKKSHVFIRINAFNAMDFDIREYLPPMKMVSWSFSWLPASYVEDLYERFG